MNRIDRLLMRVEKLTAIAENKVESASYDKIKGNLKKILKTDIERLFLYKNFPTAQIYYLLYGEVEDEKDI